MKVHNTKTLLLSLFSAFSTVSLMLPLSATIPSAIAGEAVACSNDQPCFSPSPYQSGDKAIFTFNYIKKWDYYRVGYQLSNGAMKYAENRSGMFTLNNIQPNNTYEIIVQGCRKPFLRASVCSDWTRGSITTR
jgi:hypothetical protein